MDENPAPVEANETAAFGATDAGAPGLPVARAIAIPLGPVPAACADELLLRGGRRRDAWVDIIRVALWLLVLELTASALLTWVADTGHDAPSSGTEGAEKAASRLLLPMLLIRATGTMVIVAAVLRRRRQSLPSIGLRRQQLGVDVLIGLAATPVVYVLVFMSLILSAQIWPGVSRQMEENAQRIVQAMPRLRPWGFIALAALIGTYEELLFRGFLMPRLRRATGSWTTAVFLNTAVFTSLHIPDQVPAALIAVTVLSLALSISVIWRRSIVPAMITHTLFNASQLVVLYYSTGDQWPA